MTTSRRLRLVSLLALGALYGAAAARSGRAPAHTGLDPMASDARAVELALRDERLAEALSLATALAAVHPGEAFPLFLKATAHHRLGQWAAEAEAWDRYVERSASPELACPQIAEAYDRAGNAPHALARYRSCASHDPSDPDRLADLAAALAARHMIDEAREVYGRALALDPSNATLVSERAALK